MSSAFFLKRLIGVTFLCLTAVVANAAETQSQTALERLFSERAANNLSLFGYDLFESTQQPVQPSSGAVQDSYVLGPGDELAIVLRGEVSSSTRHTVDGEGMVLIDRLRPVPAAGRSLSDFRTALQTEVNAALLQTEAYVSVASVRRINALVLGAVKQPGRVELSAFNTVLDALIAAGGVRRDGSLRRIMLVRGTATTVVDLYDLLQGKTGNGDLNLREGDRIVVPPIGPTFAVTGDVKRPAIFELGSSPVSIADALELAGGPMQPSNQRLVRLRFDKDGQEQSQDIASTEAAPLSDGDILTVSPLQSVRRNTIRLEGHVLYPGVRSLSESPSLRQLIRHEDIRPDPYLSFVVLETTDPISAQRRLEAVDLQSVLDGQSDRVLTEDDTVIVLGRGDIAFLTSTPVLSVLKGRAPNTDDAASCAGLPVLAQTLSADPVGLRARSPVVEAARTLKPVDMPCPDLFDRFPTLLSFLLDHGVLVRNGVERPGIYPVAAAPALPAPVPQSALSFADEVSQILQNDIGIPGSVSDPGDASIEIAGAVETPGVRRLADASTLRAALSAVRAREDVYPLFGVIERFDPASLSRQTIPFTPKAVLTGTYDRKLVERDRIRLFDRDEIAVLVDEKTSPVPDLMPFRDMVRDHAVPVRGAVRMAGFYPVAESVSVRDALDAAGGLTSQADPKGIEITTSRHEETNDALATTRAVLALHTPETTTTILRPGDAVRVNTLFSDRESQAVTLLGEVRRPGEYDIRRGEKLSSLLERAGGLTGQAFAEGAVFTRESARRQEVEGYARVAQELNRSLAAVLLKDNTPPADQIALAKQLSEELRNAQALGRITVEADPAVLSARPELDVLLEARDRIIIPKRPLTVTVSGEVLSPASLQFRPEKTARDYMQEAGGTTRYADADRAFVLLPDGSARPLAVSAWNHAPTSIPPGSTIIVPRDPEPYDFLDLTQSIGSVLSQLAITAASLVVISHTD